MTADERPLSVRARLSYGGFLSGGGFSITGGTTWRPSPHFNVSFDYTHRVLDSGLGNPLLPAENLLPTDPAVVPPLVPIPPGASCADPEYAPFCTGDETTVRIFSGRIELNVSPEITWNTLIQYENQTENIGINSRFRWIIEPGREIFLTLNQGLLYDGGGDEVRRAVTEPRAKVSWLYRF